MFLLNVKMSLYLSPRGRLRDEKNKSNKVGMFFAAVQTKRFGLRSCFALNCGVIIVLKIKTKNEKKIYHLEYTRTTTTRRRRRTSNDFDYTPYRQGLAIAIPPPT